ncbi:unnamed protein product [Periconia digitata]|uniref:GED domain-containing protein n=1 Tax=Periconia digitata TaxID=1303443 RepID=A0A9W4XS75_9PLEO|nr:unnamed protein product [Periconia digitata]
MIIGHLFQEQSTNWESLARKHIDGVASACKRFVLAVLSSIGTPDTTEKLSILTVLPFLKHAHSEAITELERVLADKSRHPITYNHYFTDNIQKLHQERLTRCLMENAEDSMVEVSEKTFVAGPGFVEKEYIDPAALKSALLRTIQHDMDTFAAEQALDAHDAFYKDERKYYVDVITKQAIERQLLAPLAEILSPRSIAGYTEEKIQSIASEPFEIRQLRAHLESKKKMLEEGADAFQAAVTGGQSL